MKTICLIRHAKSSWDDPSLRDIQRPLNPRGKRDAPLMAQKLKEMELDIDLCLSSPSQRTRETLVPFIEEFGIRQNEVLFIDSLFHGSFNQILTAIRSAPETASSLMLFAHNPGMTTAANAFNEGYIDNVPTCGISVIESQSETWESVSENNSSLQRFIYPKQFI